ncbi:Ubiquitin-conjugating enzyme E2 T [Pseudolycoriella hygida]|uniref:Ubiquitin-conjugating enzyme E2 T n=1 Tax=Pseudolycoriella hygida TaxID=35572 RepID=A0A9Q0S1X4_9DIPT|nr:Ubiquitin-conjugating enzyme E2 T [Pseudolycoriella hygida]
MSSQQIKSIRIAKEIRQLNSGIEQHGISCVANDDCLTVEFSGPKGSLFEDERFNLLVTFDEKYPFTPPRLKLKTPIYHPNIDKGGLICLNILRMPPTGTYNPTMTVESILLSVQLLLSSPNPHDPLRSDAASDYLLNKEIYDEKVRKQIEENRKSSLVDQINT